MQLKNISTKIIFLTIAFSLTSAAVAVSQVKILFDATKAESAGNADWVIDADAHDIDWSPGPAICSGSFCHQSDAQRIPTPTQPAAGVATEELYWDGGLSSWALDCAYKGYQVESLPAITGRITYGDVSNLQDLANYNAFVVCEPNIPFTGDEKTAMLNFVRNGGGLFIVSDHDISDRNNDGWDSPNIWNDFFQSNSTGNTNPFGIIFDHNNISETSTNISTDMKSDTLLRTSGGAGWGDVTKVRWSGGTSITIDPIANISVLPIIHETSSSGNTNVLVATARYGNGKIVAFGDSSPFDDGTGDPQDNLFTGYNGDVSPNHRNLIMNATIWIVKNSTYIFNGNGNWNIPANWVNNKIPPLLLPGGDQIIIDPVAGGHCLLNVNQHISTGAKLMVATGKDLVVQGNLLVQ